MKAVKNMIIVFTIVFIIGFQLHLFSLEVGLVETEQMKCIASNNIYSFCRFVAWLHLTTYYFVTWVCMRDEFKQKHFIQMLIFQHRFFSHPNHE